MYKHASRVKVSAGGYDLLTYIHYRHTWGVAYICYIYTLNIYDLEGIPIVHNSLALHPPSFIKKKVCYAFYDPHMVHLPFFASLHTSSALSYLAHNIHLVGI